MKNLAKKISHDFQGSKELNKVHEQNLKILVVDDQPGILEAYEQALGKKGSSETSNVVPIRSSRGAKKAESTSMDSQYTFDLIKASNFDDALAEVQRAVTDGKPFAMGFFDVLLGEGPDGFDLVKEIHKLDPKMYTVFVTAHNDRSIDSIQSYLGEEKTATWDYLSKPFVKSEILQKARNFTSLWNLNEEKVARDKQLAEVHRQLVESEKLTSVAAVARGVNHEFGNLLMQIMGKADVSLGSNDPEKMKAGLTVILEATQRANEILEKFKDLSNSRGSQGQKEVVSLMDVVDEALDLMEHKIKTSSLLVSKIKHEPVELSVDKTALLQVIVNLVINSVHAMGTSGQLDISVRKVGNYAELTLRDYGPGIPDQILESVVEPFFTTKGKEGSGLGLAICKEIVEIDHQGEFELKNHGIKGLEVKISLPIHGDDDHDA